MDPDARQVIDLRHVADGIRELHVDSHLLVLEKPSGLLSVPAKPPGTQDCLEARARAAYPDALLVHRLDGDTSGVMVFARTRLAQRHLNWQFERRQVSKIYVARVAGHVEGEAGRIDLPLISDWPNRPKQMVCHERGRPSVTDWRVIGREADATRLELTPSDRAEPSASGASSGAGPSDPGRSVLCERGGFGGRRPASASCGAAGLPASRRRRACRVQFGGSVLNTLRDTRVVFVKPLISSNNQNRVNPLETTRHSHAAPRTPELSPWTLRASRVLKRSPKTWGSMSGGTVP